MIKLIQNNKTLAYLNASDVRVTQTTDAEFTLQFSTGCKALKTEYLMQKATEIEVDGDRFNMTRCDIVKTRGEVTTFSVVANHSSYKLIEKLIDKYSVSGTVQAHMNTILSGTEFTFLGTDITESLELTVDLTNSRYMLHRLAREFNANIIFEGNGIGLYRAVGENLALTLTIDTKVKGINRSEDFTINKVCYRIEVDTLNMKEFETININDTLRIVDTELGLDDRRKVVRTEYSPILKKNISIEIGDIVEDTLCDDLIDLIEENIEVPENVITEVIHQQVINVETAHILNAWIKNLFVEFLETNMDARLDNITIDRNYIRIINEREEMIQEILDLSTLEPLKIPDPRGGMTMINVYYTAIGNHPDAYRYFTITNPKLVHEELTDKEVDAFKVLVKKVNKSTVKYVKCFKQITMSDGTTTMTPCEVWGAGTDVSGLTDKGKTIVYKDQVGYTIKQMYEDKLDFLGIRLNGVTKMIETHRSNEEGWVPGVGGSNFRSLDWYTDGFVVNGEAKFKWVPQGLQTEDGKIIPIVEHGKPMT